MKHLAVIMDGNGRWGKAKFGDRLAGHKKGAERVAEIVEECAVRGYECLSLYAFSTENFRRNKAEVEGIFAVMSSCLQDERLYNLIDKYSIRVRIAGDLKLLDKNFLSLLNTLMKRGEQNSGMILVLCIAYGGSEEMTNAVNQIVADKLVLHDETPVSFEDIKSKLYTANLPDPEAVVRYGGEMRLSNFLPLQTLYSEMIFMDKQWPDFDKKDVAEIENIFNMRVRRFGREV